MNYPHLHELLTPDQVVVSTLPTLPGQTVAEAEKHLYDVKNQKFFPEAEKFLTLLAEKYSVTRPIVTTAPPMPDSTGSSPSAPMVESGINPELQESKASEAEADTDLERERKVLDQEKENLAKEKSRLEKKKKRRREVIMIVIRLRSLTTITIIIIIHGCL